MFTFEETRYAFPGSLRGSPQCFSVVEHQKSPLRKPDLKFVASQHTWFMTGKRNLLSSQKAYLCVSVIQLLFSLYFSIQAALELNGLLMWVQKDKHTYIHTKLMVTITQLSLSRILTRGCLGTNQTLEPSVVNPPSAGMVTYRRTI